MKVHKAFSLKPIHPQFLIKLLIILCIGISSFQHLPPPDTIHANQQMQRATALLKTAQYEYAMPILKEAAGIYEQAKSWDRYIAACQKLDDCFYYLDLPDTGVLFFKEALARVENHREEEDLKAHLFFILANNYYSKGDYELACQTYETGLPFAEKEKINTLLKSYYGNLGRLYWDAGNHAKALEFQQKSLQLAILQKDTANIPTLLYYIGDTYRTMNDPQAFNYFRRALKMAPDHVQTRIQFSKTFQQFNMPDSALAVLGSVLPLLREESEKADAYYQFARLYLETKDIPKAVSHIAKALNYGKKGYGEKHEEYARITTMAGNIYLAAGDADRALLWFDQTLFQQSAVEQPDLKDLPPGSYWTLASLEGKGKAFFRKYQQSKDARNLYPALDAFDLGLLYGEKMRLSHSHESSKLELYEYMQPIVEGCVKTSLELATTSGNNGFIEKAYLFAERAKAPVMAEGLYDKEIKHIAGIPDSILMGEKVLQKAIVGLELDVYHEPENDSLQNALLNTRLDLERLKGEIKKRFPRYFELKYAFSKQTDLQQIRRHLDDGSLLIQYLMGDSTLYSFAVSKNGVKAYTLPFNDSLYRTMEKFRKSVSDWDFVQHSASQAEKDFLATAPMLYDWLLARPLTEMKARKLIIVPDGYLGLIPFEAVLTEPYSGTWKDLEVPYLIRNYAVGYAWSAGALGQTNAVDNTPKYNFVGIGTEYNAAAGAGDTAVIAMRNLGPLPNADDEVEAIGNLLHGKTWLNAEATKANFLASAPDCGILHVATHGILDEQNPMLSCLVFNNSEEGNNNRLFASELYNIQLQAQMTVLSACNTGQGRADNGEGVMSLARAFAFAGCPTLVSSLWSVNDRSTSDVMKGFYRLLKEGKPVDESMQGAKLNYLKSTTSEYAKPVYWAGFVVIGNNNALPGQFFDAGISGWWIAAGGLAGIGALYFFIVRRNLYRAKSR